MTGNIKSPEKQTLLTPIDMTPSLGDCETAEQGENVGVIQVLLHGGQKLVSLDYPVTVELLRAVNPCLGRNQNH